MSGLAAIFVAVVLTLISTLAMSEPFEEGVAAANRGDYATALRLWQPLAYQGDASAQSNLGLMYATGQGVPQDYAEAVRWYRRAADQGHASPPAWVIGTAWFQTAPPSRSNRNK